MTNLQAVLKPGDVLAVRGGGWEAEAIRVGEELSGKPGLDNHVAVMSHWTGDVPWGLEGKPGGVGWADMRRYVASPYTVNNCGQPGRTDAARQRVARRAQAMLATAYDWTEIADDTLRAFHMADLWASDWHGLAPGSVVCSSYAAWLYEQEGWAHPNVPDRDTEPGDWTAFALDHGYSVSLR
jgi:hypothetical protein